MSKGRHRFPAPAPVPGNGQPNQPPALPLTQENVADIVRLSRMTGKPAGAVGNDLIRMALLTAECQRLSIYYGGALQAIQDGQMPDPQPEAAEPPEQGEDPEVFRERLKREAAGESTERAADVPPTEMPATASEGYNGPGESAEGHGVDEEQSS